MINLNKALFLTSFFSFLILISSFFFLNDLNAESIDSDSNSITENGTVEKTIKPDDADNQKGLKVFIDPDTGEIIAPSRDEIESLHPSNSGFEADSFDESIVEEAPDGSTTIIFPESFQFSNKATIEEDGNIKSECVREHEQNK